MRDEDAPRRARNLDAARLLATASAPTAAALALASYWIQAWSHPRPT